MKTLFLSAASAACVAAAFLAGATWAASSERQPVEAGSRPVTVYAGSTALTLPAAVLARLPAVAEARATPTQASGLHVVLEARP